MTPPLTRAGAARRLAPKPPTEEAIHRAVVDLLARAAVPGIAWTHMPSGEARGPGIGGKLKGMGVKPGWPDILLVRGGQLYGLELKRDTGRLSPSQVKAHAEIVGAGGHVSVVWGLDDAIRKLRAWGMIRTPEN